MALKTLFKKICPLLNASALYSECALQREPSSASALFSECALQQARSSASAPYSECALLREHSSSSAPFSECALQWVHPSARALYSECVLHRVLTNQIRAATFKTEERSWLFQMTQLIFTLEMQTGNYSQNLLLQICLLHADKQSVKITHLDWIFGNIKHLRSTCVDFFVKKRRRIWCFDRKVLLLT